MGLLSVLPGPDRFLVTYPVVGAVLASRRRANPIGWILLGMGLLAAVRALAAQYALHVLAGPARPEAGVWAVWYVDWSFSLLFPAGLLAFLVLLFPDGRALTARWRAVGWLAAGLTAVYLLVTWLGPGPIALGSGLPSVRNPTAVPSLIHVARESGANGGIWALGFVALLAAVVAGPGLALPVSIGVAVLKYRLYAVDRIISRTVSYALVTGVVVGVYLGCVALLTRVLPFRGSVGVAGAVLAAAALFSPLRRRVQALVDRRFDRARYDAERVVVQFAGQLREQVDLDVMGADLLGVVHQVLAPEHVTLWLSGQDGT